MKYARNYGSHNHSLIHVPKMTNYMENQIQLRFIPLFIRKKGSIKLKLPNNSFSIAVYDYSIRFFDWNKFAETLNKMRVSFLMSIIKKLSTCLTNFRRRNESSERKIEKKGWSSHLQLIIENSVFMLHQITMQSNGTAAKRRHKIT